MPARGKEQGLQHPFGQSKEASGAPRAPECRPEITSEGRDAAPEQKKKPRGRVAAPGQKKKNGGRTAAPAGKGKGKF